MIEWMQRHKKWLVITIWISTISFIASGMVGWGSYNFSLSEGVVAKVGEIEVTKKQLQGRYQQIYTQYNAEGKLDEQQAKDLGLKQKALDSLIEQALLENFGLDLGLRVTEDEVAKEIAKITYFQRDGKFSKELYKELLKQNNINPTDFEKDVYQNLLIQKVATLVSFGKTTKLEQKAFSAPFLIVDDIKLKIFTGNDVKIKLSQEEIKNFWEKNKNEFKNPAEYKIDYVLIDEASQKPSEEDLKNLYETTKNKYVNQEGNQQDYSKVKDLVLEEQRAIMAEDRALREYIALKKANKIYGTEKIIVEGDRSFGVEVLEALESGKIGDTIKPIKTSLGFIAFKIVEKKPQSPKSFEDAKMEAKELLKEEKEKEALIHLAKEKIQTGFEGKIIQAINALEEKKIQGLSQEEIQKLVAKILVSQNTRGYFSFGDKIAVFEILNQKTIINQTLIQKANNDTRQFLEYYKGQIVSKEFYKYLRNKYKIIYLKENLD